MNDIPMLEAVPNSIAMGESPEKLKQLSSFVTKNLLDDGIEYALRYFNII
jgi:hydroxymethylpyrimidine pyrophosphatase-like HAD family hydrolase